LASNVKTRDERQKLAERAVAAGVLVTIVALGGRTIVPALRSDASTYINFVNRDFGIIVPLPTRIRDQIAPPLAACDQWIKYQSVSPWSRLTFWFDSTLTLSNTNWVGIDADGADSFSQANVTTLNRMPGPADDLRSGNATTEEAEP
jgi:hypothetical protein